MKKLSQLLALSLSMSMSVSAQEVKAPEKSSRDVSEQKDNRERHARLKQPVRAVGRLIHFVVAATCGHRLYGEKEAK